jgi:N6-adenosine-specific RNA methylase IME4
MKLTDICDIPIPAKKDSVLFLWVPVPLIQQGIAVMKAWGFDYRTGMVWVKNTMGMGYYFRGRHELLFVGAKGKGKIPATADRQDSVILGERKEHSKKPEQVYTIIETAYPNCSYLELFARNPRLGWESWGDELAI